MAGGEPTIPFWRGAFILFPIMVRKCFVQSLILFCDESSAKVFSIGLTSQSCLRNLSYGLSSKYGVQGDFGVCAECC